MTTAIDLDVATWHGCYDSSWRGLITPGAFAHPAKMARGLVVRIYDELFAMGAIQRGSVVVDPFGGIGTTAIEGALRGVQVYCCELEPRFVGLAGSNFELHRELWERASQPIPRIVLGDSRRLREHLAPVMADALVSSPPYATEQMGGGGAKREDKVLRAMMDGYGHTHGQLGEMSPGDVDAVISSPPYATGTFNNRLGIDLNLLADGQRPAGWNSQARTARDYGDSDGQLASMPEGNVDAVVSSPPYVAIASGAGGLNTKPPKNEGQQGGRSASSASQDTDQRYGTTDGQLARLPEGEVDAIVSSPPFGSGDSASAQSITTRTDKSAAWVKKNCGSAATEGYGVTDGQLGVMRMHDVADALVSSPPWEKGAEGTVRASKFKDPESFARQMSANDGQGTRNGTTPESRLAQFQRSDAATYGDAEGQMGNASGDTFWSAARDIVAESIAILKPGGVAVWVVKAYVKNKRIVDFPGDWRKLCEHVGFETFLEVRASLVHEESRTDIFGAEHVRRRERKSFFRRLAEKKGSPRIDHETVWFMRKPA